MNILDWSKAPDWATAMMRRESGRLFYVEEFGRDNCKAVAVHEPYDKTNPCFGGYAKWVLLAHRPLGTITLTPAEVSSGYDRVQWAEDLILQLPKDHEGRNSWLMNYGDPVKLAADEREAAVQDLIKVTCISHGEARLIYDAGYRKQEEK